LQLDIKNAKRNSRVVRFLTVATGLVQGSGAPDIAVPKAVLDRFIEGTFDGIRGMADVFHVYRHLYASVKHKVSFTFKKKSFCFVGDFCFYVFVLTFES
jgi:hypothetical protein